MTKRFVCVGINTYEGAELVGCVNDAVAWSTWLTDGGYEGTMLLDALADGTGIVRALQTVVEASKPGDRIVFTFSGHGTYYQDTSGDEPDKRDEAICPADVFAHGALRDDDLAALFAARRVGVRVTLVMDCCHSGTVARFLPARVAAGTPKFITPQMIPGPPQTVPPPARSRSLPAQPLMLLSGCADHEFSYDTEIDGRPCGAFTHACMKALAVADPKTWSGLALAVRTVLPSDAYPQTPQFEATAWQRRWKIP